MHIPARWRHRQRSLNREELGGKTAAEYLFEKALLALKDRDRDKALDFLANCIKADPDHAEAWMIRGNIEHAEGRFLNSLLHHDRAVSVAPNKYDAWNNRGIAFVDLGLFASARECFEKSIGILDAYEARMNLANLYCHLMELEKAEEQYRAALAGHVLDYEAHIQLGLALMGQGRWAEGLPHYEERLKNSPHPPREEQRWPRWRGESLVGKTLLVWPEQGVGDEIMMLRFASVLNPGPGAKVIVEARPPMYRAAKTLAGVDAVIVQHDEPPFPVDYQCALTDLPMVLGIEPKTIPLAQGYLFQGRAPWLSLPGDTFNVGICWKSGRRPLQPEVEASFKTKSIPIEWIAPLAQKGVQLYSLQKEHDDFAMMRKFGIIDLMGDVHDFADTAALVNSLDLVISVDTAVAHLAGAMGRPVWNFVRYSGYWPWMRESGVTQWYESMRLYRQPELGNWDDPIKRAAADLGELAAQKQNERAA